MFPEFLMMDWVTGVSSGTELHNFAFLLIVVFCNNLIVVGIQLLHLHLNVWQDSYNLEQSVILMYINIFNFSSLYIIINDNISYMDTYIHLHVSILELECILDG